MTEESQEKERERNLECKEGVLLTDTEGIVTETAAKEANGDPNPYLHYADRCLSRLSKNHPADCDNFVQVHQQQRYPTIRMMMRITLLNSELSGKTLRQT